MQGNISGIVTEHATSGNATEHVIARWQAQFWRNSKDCQHVIQVLLSLQAKAIHQHSRLQVILARQLPPLFTPNQEHAFFAVLQHKTITDVKLRESIVDFCARWGGEHEAGYQELLADSGCGSRSECTVAHRYSIVAVDQKSFARRNGVD